LRVTQYLTIELRKLRSVLSNRLVSKVAFTEPEIEQFHPNTKQFKSLRRRSLDSMLLKLHGRPPLPEWSSSNFISPRLANSRLRPVIEGFQKDKRNLDYLVTSRASSTTVNQQSEPANPNEEYISAEPRLVKENKVMAKLLALSQAKSIKMKEELKKAKALLVTLSKKCDKLQNVNIERNQAIDNLRRQLSYFEDRYYSRMGTSKGHQSFTEGSLPEELLQARFNQQKDDEIEAADDEKMVNISMLDHSNVIDLSKVNKQSVMKRKRNNKGSIHILGKDRDQLFKKPSSPGKTPLLLAAPSFSLRPAPIEEEPRLSRTSSPELPDFEDIDYREAFKIEESKAYLTQMAKELLLDINSRAKYAFAKMKNNKYIDFGLLPTPVIKVDRSISCPPLTYSKKARSGTPRDADATLFLDKVGFQVSDDYSIDCDFDELKKLIMKHA
jgi:hypothetical protein